MNLEEPVLSQYTKATIKAALEEDIGSGDFTTLWSVPGDHRSRARIIARAGGVISGMPVAEYLTTLVEPSPTMISAIPDGQTVSAGRVVAELAGYTRPLLAIERTLLNFLQRLSGISTLTRHFVEKVEGTGVKILDTRKTTPCLRELEKYAVRIGGGFNHRFGLYDYVLLKENHISAAGSIRNAIEAIRAANDIKLPVEIETRTLDEVREAVQVGVSRIMLDNMTVEQIRIAVEIIRDHKGGPIPEIEASGDINLRTIAEVAATGVDFISVGALTHSPGILNLTMLIDVEPY